MELSTEEGERLAAMLGTTVGAADYSEKLEQLKELAFEEYVEWLLARRRFESVSALDHKRVLEVFSKIRGEAPSVSILANEFDLSESRAVSMLSRMRYGNARVIRQLQYEAARRELRAQREGVGLDNGLNYLWLKRETARIVEEANTSIMRDTTARSAGGRFEGAELARKTEPGRFDEQWATTPKMWDLIDLWIGDQSPVTT